jgi:mono/diheme cytochrome c family protein
MRFAGILFSILMGFISIGCSSGFGLKDLSPWASLGDPVKGREIYVNYCIHCHGADGKGALGIRLVPPPADLSSDAVQSRLARTLFSRIHGGTPSIAMGAWTRALSDDDIWDVLDYVRTLRDGKASRP